MVDNIDSVDTLSSNEESSEGTFTILRKRTHQTARNGYLFLAIIFAMMCASSINLNSITLPSVPTLPKSVVGPSFSPGRDLKFFDPYGKQTSTALS
jgi:hypothetical protein